MKPDGFPGNLSPLQQDLVRELGGGGGPDTLLMVPVSDGARSFRDELARRLRMELLPP